MKILPIINKQKFYNPYNIGPSLGDGANGEVFELVNTSKVVKFSALYDYNFNNLHINYNKIINNINFLKRSDNNSYAKVYEVKHVGDGYRVCDEELLQYYVVYSYTMEKLNKISEDEKKVFHSILSHEDLGIVKKYTINKINEMLLGMSIGLDFDINKVLFFYNEIKKINIIHEDLHDRNIMKDNKGNFKLIDFDRINIGEKND